MKVDNAVILAAGTSSRFAPLSYERPKAMIEVKGEILIERQIRQLKEAGIPDIYIVTGYKAEQFEYLASKYGVILINNPEYSTRNNNGSIWKVRDILANSYICSADNYFIKNPFNATEECAYYSAEYAYGYTDEWCIDEDENGIICNVSIGGQQSWYMIGHAFWDEQFSTEFLEILHREYDDPDTFAKLWEKIYIEHIDELKMKIKKYSSGTIMEFDTLDELRMFDSSYIYDTRSAIIKRISRELNVEEKCIHNITAIKDENQAALGFQYECGSKRFTYYY